QRCWRSVPARLSSRNPRQRVARPSRPAEAAKAVNGLARHIFLAAHFSLDSRNENLPEKYIHQDCAETPGRETAPGFLLRGRARARRIFFAARQGEKP